MSRPLTPLGLAVLRLLAEGQMHPYEMQQRVREYAIDQVVKVAHGSLYHAVARLAEQGLIAVGAGRSVSITEPDLLQQLVDHD